MATTSPARIDDDLYASAKLAGGVQSRSASQQVVHWARIGREIEASATISHKDIAEVLAGSRSYDMLSAKEQAVVRAEWSTRMDALAKDLNFAREFATVGRSWVELDDHDAVVERSDVKAAKKVGTGKLAGNPSGRSGTTKRKKTSGRGAGTRSGG